MGIRVRLLQGLGTSCIVLALACNALDDTEEILRTVRTTEARPVVEMVSEQTFTGFTRAAVDTRLSFRVSGNVEEMQVTEGQEVTAGALVAVLEKEDYALKVEQARAGLAQARAVHEEAALTKERMDALYEEEAVSRSAYDSARTAARAALANVEAARRQLTLAERRLGYTTLEAPTSGYITYVGTEEGENVAPGQVIAALSAEGQLEVVLAIPAGATGLVDVGAQVIIALPEVSNDAQCEGVVTQAGESPPPLQATYPVVVQILDPPEDALPGMAAEVTFREVRAYDPPRFFLPLHAVGEDRRGDRFVFVIGDTDEQGAAKVAMRVVEIAERVGDQLAIVGGLSEGDRVVTRGVSQLDNGMRVLVDAGESEGPPA